jgi:hypothetical protein
VPYDVRTSLPVGAATPATKPVYSLGLRMVFDWRYYY